MAAREVFAFTSSQGDIRILENDVTSEIGFITAKAPLGGGSKRSHGTVWLSATLVLAFVDSLQSLDLVKREAIKKAAEAAAAEAAQAQSEQ